MAAPDRSRVLAAHGEGIAALEDIARRLGPADWLLPCCGAWTATDLAGHVLAVAGWYHEWLDRAILGRASAPFVSAELGARNAAALAALDAADAAAGAAGTDVDAADGPTPGPAPRRGLDRVARFAHSARRYAERAVLHWERPYGFPYGRVTVGVHLGAAAAEWNVHAWDLSTLTGAPHRPSDPALLYELLGTALSAGRTSLLPPGVSIGLSRRTPRRAARRQPDPWAALLERTGRC